MIPASGNAEYCRDSFCSYLMPQCDVCAKPPVYGLIVLHIHVISAGFQSVSHSCIEGFLSLWTADIFLGTKRIVKMRLIFEK